VWQHARKDHPSTEQEKSVRRLIATLGVLVVALLGLGVSPASAVNIIPSGWYTGQPFPEVQCGSQVQLAQGSDGRPMLGQVCLFQNSGGLFQPIGIIINESHSAATGVVANLTGDSNGTETTYTCHGKTIAAYGVMSCVGVVDVNYGSESAWADITMNGYGGRVYSS
jgi:hypothetical protein